MKKGFSLIELVIVISVVGIIFSGVLPLIFKTTTLNRSAQLKLNAYEAAQQEIENLQGENIGSLENYTFNPSGIPGSVGRVIVDKTIGGSTNNFASVTSRVSWVFQNKNEQIELKTYFYGEE